MLQAWAGDESGGLSVQFCRAGLVLDEAPQRLEPVDFISA